MQMKPLTVGEIGVHVVVETSRRTLSFREFLPDSTPEALEHERGWLEPRFGDLATGLAYLSFHTYVVRTPRATILVDTCVGNDKDRGGHAIFHMLRTNWLENLEASGLRAHEVDYVMCTHMHADHIGWNTRLVDGRWVPTFPRARYVFARREYEHRERIWRSGPGYGSSAFADSVLPVVESGQAVIVDDGYDLDDSIALEPAPGHTPGNVVIHARSRGEAAVFSGDVIHHPVQVKYPEWSAAFCEDKLQSAACRRRFVETHAEAGTLVLPAHFPAPTAGRIRRDAARWRFEFIRD
jgi:glyoxylase-like metal-dependent hydrolase (beta-lactamase superfamily II)